MIPYFNKFNSHISKQDYADSFIKEINIKEDIPHNKRTVRFIIVCWSLIALKCVLIAWAVSHYKIPFSAWWIIAPTVAFAAWVSLIYFSRD